MALAVISDRWNHRFNMSDQFRKRWDREQRRQRALKPDYLEEIKLDKQKGPRLTCGQFESDSEFRSKNPEKFILAKGNKDRVFAFIEDPCIFLKEGPAGPLFMFFPSDSLHDFAELNGLDSTKKSVKHLLQRLKQYGNEIKTILKEEFRHWPMRAFVNPPLPRQFHFSNGRGMAASVVVFSTES